MKQNSSRFNIFSSKINFQPNKQNSFVWFNVFFVIALLFSGNIAPESIVFAFFFETIIIGVLHVFKLLKVYYFTKSKGTITRKEDGLFAPVFFSIHYSFFVAIQLVFVFSFISLKGIKDITEPFHLLHNINYVISNLKGIKLVLLSLIISNTMDFYLNFIQNEKYKSLTMQDLFFQPYLRIIVQQFAVIFGGFLMIFKIALTSIAILILLIKALVDLYFLNNITFNEMIKKVIDEKAKKRS